MRALARAAAGVVAVALLWPVAIGIAWTLLMFAIAAVRPDPTVPDGDPCCGYPDNWAEVAAVAAQGVVLAAITVSLMYVTITFAGFAIKGERPKLRGRRRAVAALATVVAAFAVYTAVVFVMH